MTTEPTGMVGTIDEVGTVNSLRLQPATNSIRAAAVYEDIRFIIVRFTLNVPRRLTDQALATLPAGEALTDGVAGESKSVR